MNDALWEELKDLSRPAKAPEKPKRKKKRSHKVTRIRNGESCKVKKTFKSIKHARNTLRGRGAGFTARVYLCDICTLYHIANRDK